MMNRFIAPGIAWLGRLLLGAPLIALVVAAFVDLGPEGRTRVSPFPLVLSIYDTILATSLVQSVAVAGSAALASLALGLTLGSLMTGRSFWGRPVFSALVSGLSILPPTFLTLGLLGLLEGTLRHASFGRSAAEPPDPGEFPFGWLWRTWLLAAIIPGAATVAKTASRGLGRVNPTWADAARLAGATRLRIWLGVSWPRIRPGVLHAVLAVFVQTLADPGPPLILGLRRTLGFQLVSTALDADPFPRAAAVGLITVAVSLAVASVAYRRGIARHPEVDLPTTPERRGLGSPSPGAIGLAVRYVVFPSFLLLAWLPIVGLAEAALLPAPAPPGERGLPRAYREAVHESPVLRPVIQSVGAGVAVAIVATLMARWMPLRPARARRWALLPRGLDEFVPPLVTGVGILALIRVAWLTAMAPGESGTHEGAMARWATLPSPFDLRTIPGLFVVFGMVLVDIPRRLAVAGVGEFRGDDVLGRIEQARSMGVGRGKALSLARAGGRAIPFSAIVLWSVLASVTVAPAIILSGPEADWGVGPSVVTRCSRPGDSRRQAARLALGAIGVSLTALALARRGARPMST